MSEPIVPIWRELLAEFDGAADPQPFLDRLIQEAFRRPGEFELHLMLAERMFARGRDARGLAINGYVLACGDPHFRFRAHLQRADHFRRHGAFREAEADIEAARAIDPGSHWPVLAMAENLAQEGRVGERGDYIRAEYEGLRPESRAEIARHYAGWAAFDHFDRTRASPGWQPRRPGRVPALERAGMILLVKDEEDIIGQNLSHHYALGFRAFCVLNNMSTDNTREIVSRFRDSHDDCFVLLVDDPVRGHYQADKMRVYAETLQRHTEIAGLRLDWLFFIDADEFIASDTSRPSSEQLSALERRLNDPDTRVMVMHWIHAASPQVLEEFGSEDDPFEKINVMRYRLLPLVPKVAYRVGFDYSLKNGNHFIEKLNDSLDSVVPVGCDDWYIYHFSLRSLSHVRKKIINGGHAFVGTRGLNDHGQHWRERYALFQKYGDRIISEVLEEHVRFVPSLHPPRIDSPEKRLPTRRVSSDIEPIDIKRAVNEISGIEAIEIAKAYTCERPEPAFVKGPVTSDIMNDFRRERSVWPISVYKISDVEIHGPWFNAGIILVSQGHRFRIDEIYQPAGEQPQDICLEKSLHELQFENKRFLEINEDCVLLATNGHNIYGHWLVDFLPKIYLLDYIGIDVSKIKFLMPSDVGHWAIDLMNLVGIKKENLIIYDQNEIVPLCRSLFVPTLLRMSGRTSPLFLNATEFINKRIDKNIQTKSDVSNTFLYFDREQEFTWRKIDGHDKIIKLFNDLNFHIVRPEKLSISEQIRLVRGAKVIAGQHGSALHSTIFCQDPVFAVVLHENRRNWFAGLQAGIGEYLGHQTGYIFGETSSHENIFSTRFEASDIRMGVDFARMA